MALVQQSLRGIRQQSGSWVRNAEHLVMRLVSLAFSLASAHAIRWFFAPMDHADVLQPYITWGIAIGFGVLGFFVSRGIAHRMMNNEPVWLYIPICLVVEVVEIFCNFSLAASVVQNATWLGTVPPGMHDPLIYATYLVLSIVPLVSILLAVVDMDMERRRVSGWNGHGAAPKVAPKQAPAWGGTAAQPQAGYPTMRAPAQGGAGAKVPLQVQTVP
ncbi:hypothetical protein [Ktedonobacter robiniae]|uniref:TRAP transporter small permease n=1 Tax=Ktedonobacter robiniae TaxID=2778365 RepID=A0ABQ3UJQ4_9CHLR|nr:hypothetical protein [Ktedonobacter robiniae]GHO52893.1 hypothetical protein KSB_13680 [Ktedonobacter robiniae]